MENKFCYNPKCHHHTDMTPKEKTKGKRYCYKHTLLCRRCYFKHSSDDKLFLCDTCHEAAQMVLAFERD